MSLPILILIENLYVLPMYVSDQAVLSQPASGRTVEVVMDSGSDASPHRAHLESNALVRMLVCYGLGGKVTWRRMDVI